MLDACQSGAFSRIKGAAPAADFSFSSRQHLDAAGIAVLASSSGSELSQESPEIGGSYFTHNLLVGLRGAGDANNDGEVTIDEAYRYAYNQTLLETAETAVGGQHVTFEADLKGHGEVPLSFPRAASAAIVLPAALQGKTLVSDRRGRSVVAEIYKSKGAPVRIAVAPGDYDVLVRDGDTLEHCEVTAPGVVDLGSCGREAVVASTTKGGGFDRPSRIELSGTFGDDRSDGYTNTLSNFGYQQQGFFAIAGGPRLTGLRQVAPYTWVGLRAGYEILPGWTQSVVGAESIMQTFSWHAWTFDAVGRASFPFARYFSAYVEGELGLGIGQTLARRRGEHEPHHERRPVDRRRRRHLLRHAVGSGPDVGLRVRLRAGLQRSDRRHACDRRQPRRVRDHGAILAMRIQWTIALVALACSQLGATDCGNVLKDPGFDLWCDGQLCAWQVERGCGLAGADVESGGLRRRIRRQRRRDLADLAGVVDRRQLHRVRSDRERRRRRRGRSQLRRVRRRHDRLHATRTDVELGAGLVHSSRSAGCGRACDSRSRSMATATRSSRRSRRSSMIPACATASPASRPPGPLGGGCGPAEPCGSGGAARGRARLRCRDRQRLHGLRLRKRSCGSGDVCGLGDPISPVVDVPTECVPANARQLGEPCIADGECATGICTMARARRAGSTTAIAKAASAEPAGRHRRHGTHTPFVCDPGTRCKRPASRAPDADCTSGSCMRHTAMNATTAACARTTPPVRSTAATSPTRSTMARV